MVNPVFLRPAFGVENRILLIFGGFFNALFACCYVLICFMAKVPMLPSAHTTAYYGLILHTPHILVAVFTILAVALRNFRLVHVSMFLWVLCLVVDLTIVGVFVYIIATDFISMLNVMFVVVLICSILFLILSFINFVYIAKLYSEGQKYTRPIQRL